jgi:hypothetical protein
MSDYARSFLHELRGIGQCSDLIKLGKDLEKEMGSDEGQFILENRYYFEHKRFRKFKHEFIGPVGAAWVIYAAMIAGWLYVAVSRFF